LNRVERTLLSAAFDFDFDLDFDLVLDFGLAFPPSLQTAILSINAPHRLVPPNQLL
jgi:hypothetical protein